MKAIFSIEIILFKIICDKIIQTYIPSCVMLLPFNKLVNNFIAFILERLSLINNNRYTYSMNGIINS